MGLTGKSLQPQISCTKPSLAEGQFSAREEKASEDCYGKDKQGHYAIFPRAPEGNV